MDYSKAFLGASINDLTYQHVIDYFLVERDESDKIEYKSFVEHTESKLADKYSAVLRTISGMLNSDGGIIIWGAPVGTAVPGKKEKIFVGDLSPIPFNIEKDAFINKVSDLLTPSPAAIKFKCAEFNEQFVTIIEIEKSEYAPHQFKNTYYMRIDGQTKPAPHHYVEAMFRRITFPKLSGQIGIKEFMRTKTGYRFVLRSVITNESPLQNEFDLYWKINLESGFFTQSNSIHITKGLYYSDDGRSLTMHNAKSTLYFGDPYEDFNEVSIWDNELIDGINDINININFGGKSSPLVYSEYVFRIDTSRSKTLPEMSLTCNKKNTKMI